uniref:Uncharacterized protein n=1 Tax=Anopheles atroparvus TaxID=41427 RepID=A0A182IPS6_ANOAO
MSAAFGMCPSYAPRTHGGRIVKNDKERRHVNGAAFNSKELHSTNAHNNAEQCAEESRLSRRSISSTVTSSRSSRLPLTPAPSREAQVNVTSTLCHSRPPPSQPRASIDKQSIMLIFIHFFACTSGMVVIVSTIPDEEKHFQH